MILLQTSLTPPVALLVGLGIAFAVMICLWLVQKRSGDAGIVDVGWTFLLGILPLTYALLLDGVVWRKFLVAGLAIAWSGRLGYYLLVDRVMGKEEDGRYQKIRRNWKGDIQTFFFYFFLAQGLLDVILSIPMLVAILNPSDEFGIWAGLGIALWAISISGESIADAQLRRFRLNPENKGKVCRDGL
ncbi:MAG: DUF1295 domain-containing protein, partial [Phycisphaerae bacterium]